MAFDAIRTWVIDFLTKSVNEFRPGKSDDIEGSGLDGKERGEGERGFWIDFGIVLNVYFDAIRIWVIDFSTKIVHDF